MVRDPIRWLAKRDAIPRPPESREFVNDVLGQLIARRFSPAAWSTFLARSVDRSVDQLRQRPAATAELTALHLLASAAGRWRWAMASWVLCITHVGLLGERSTLGWPNRLTLLRALLPALAPASRWPALVALVTDFADGRLARKGRESAFGAFADPIADGAFWSWFALRWETDGWLRWVPTVMFAGTVGAIAAAYFVRGRTIDYPRPMALRYLSGATQIALTLRALRWVVA